jgi:hypothetical protein
LLSFTILPSLESTFLLRGNVNYRLIFAPLSTI